MSTDTITEIPISSIRMSNPRSRSKAKWQTIVQSIGAVGLKRPVTVIRRPVPDSLGKMYDLVCGQGRVEAVAALGEDKIPAIVIDVPQDDLLLMSLVENIARRPPSNTALLREVKMLREKSYQIEQIAEKIGVDRAYIYGVVHLVEKGEEDLVKAVEAGRIPLSIAIEIAAGNDQQISRALSEAYERGELRGNKIRAARRIITNRIAKAKREGRTAGTRVRLTGQSVLEEYKQKIREQKLLVAKAERAREQLLLLTTAIKTLMADENFTTLLRAEGLDQIPAELAARLE